MDFRKFPAILAFLLLTVLIVQPALSADNLADAIDRISADNVTKIVTNYTAVLENDTATKFFNYGEQALNLGDFGNAITYFDQALAENTTILIKTDALLYLYRDKAYAQIQLGKYNDAIITLDKGLSRYPNDAMLWNNKGYALSRAGKTQDALTAYDKAVSFDRNYTNAYINQGNLLSQMGRYTEAVAAYNQADKTDPGNSAAAEGLSIARKGESESTQTMMILLAIILVVAAGIVVWYVKFRKPADAAPEEKKKRSRKK